MNNEEISDTFIGEVCGRLIDGKSIQRSLPGGGKLNIERPLPFLCVYRRQAARLDAGTHLFVNEQAAYLNAPGDASVRAGLDKLVMGIAETSAKQWGAFMIIEIWSAPDEEVPVLRHPKTSERLFPRAHYRIHAQSPLSEHDGTPDILKFELRRAKVQRQTAEVLLAASSGKRSSPDPAPMTHPPGTKPL